MDLTNVTFAIYMNGRLFRSGALGNMTYEAAEAFVDQLERDYPGCRVDLGEW